MLTDRIRPHSNASERKEEKDREMCWKRKREVKQRVRKRKCEMEGEGMSREIKGKSEIGRKVEG